jgi:hypothetical protein
MADGKLREAEVYMHHKDGHRILVSVRLSALLDKKGAITGGIELFSDITNHVANELRVKELEKLALLDNLTQLANRHYIKREIQSRLGEKKRFNVPFGILFIDIIILKKLTTHMDILWVIMFLNLLQKILFQTPDHLTFMDAGEVKNLLVLYLI